MPETAPAPAPAIHPVRIGTQSDILGESPIWSEQEQALYWIDTGSLRCAGCTWRALASTPGRCPSWSARSLSRQTLACSSHSPNLARFYDKLMERPAFADSAPKA